MWISFLAEMDIEHLLAVWYGRLLVGTRICKIYNSGHGHIFLVGGNKTAHFQVNCQLCLLITSVLYEIMGNILCYFKLRF